MRATGGLSLLNYNNRTADRAEETEARLGQGKSQASLAMRAPGFAICDHIRRIHQLLPHYNVMPPSISPRRHRYDEP